MLKAPRRGAFSFWFHRAVPHDHRGLLLARTAHWDMSLRVLRRAENPRTHQVRPVRCGSARIATKSATNCCPAKASANQRLTPPLAQEPENASPSSKPGGFYGWQPVPTELHILARSVTGHGLSRESDTRSPLPLHLKAGMALRQKRVVKHVGTRQGQMSQTNTRVAGVATATPPTRFTQEEVLRRFAVQDRRIRSVFLNGGISTRHLALPSDSVRDEPQEELLERHRRIGVELGRTALLKCLDRMGMDIGDVKYLCCATTTGLLTPGFSALLFEELGMRCDCGRLDVVGMGCNAGLNALNAVVNWSRAHPGELAVMLCIEVCSAAYVFDTSIDTAVVNSLFGDGVAAAGIMTSGEGHPAGPAVKQFCSHLIPATLDVMGSTGAARTTSSASLSTRMCPTSWELIRKASSRTCSAAAACGARTFRTGSSTRAARR